MLPIGAKMVYQFQQDRAVFESTINSLAENGTMACAASPSSRARPACHGEHLMVTMAPVGLAKKFSVSPGTIAAASGKRDEKSSPTSARVAKRAKLSRP